MNRSLARKALLVSVTLLAVAAAAVPAHAQGAPLADVAVTDEPFACENPYDRCAWRNATLVLEGGAFTLLVGVSVHCVAYSTSGDGGCFGPAMPLEPTGAAVASTSDAHAVSAGTASEWPQAARADAHAAGTHVVNVALVDGDARVSVLP